MGFFRHPFVVKRRRDGTFDVVVEPRLRDHLVHLFSELDELLDEAPDDPVMRRLQPPAYLDDGEREAAYRLLAGEELRTSRRVAMERSLAALDGGTLSEDELWALLRSFNALRLVLGTRLDVSEDPRDLLDLDPDHPDAPVVAAYEQLGFLQYVVLTALDR